MCVRTHAHMHAQWWRCPTAFGDLNTIHRCEVTQISKMIMKEEFKEALQLYNRLENLNQKWHVLVAVDQEIAVTYLWCTEMAGLQ